MASSQICAGYMYAVDANLTIAYRANESAKPVDCANQTLNGWGPPQHQALSCCDENARFATQIGIIGGFGNLPYYLPGKGELASETAGDETYEIECAPYIDNLKATVCDPNQGSFVRKDPTTNQTVFRICQSSCDRVFQQCRYLLPRVNATSQIANGTEFCQASWKTVWFEEDSCHIDLNTSDGFLCALDVRLQVAEDDCLNMIMPSKDDIESYKYNGYPIDACILPENITETQIGVIAGVSAVAGIAIFLAVILFCWIRRRRKEEEFADNT
jgi:hypothetical protein